MTTISATEARAALYTLLDDVAATHEPVLITGRRNNAVLVADGGDFVATASYVMHPRAPLSWLDPGAFGTLGVGAGFALGAALARPGSEVGQLLRAECGIVEPLGAHQVKLERHRSAPSRAA